MTTDEKKPRCKIYNEDDDIDSCDGDLDEDVWQALADRRRELCVDVVDGLDPFFWNLRGGRWARERVGVAFDSFRAQSRGGEPSTFCEIHKLQKTATFSIARYNEETCLALCRFWCHRMSLLYNIWRSSGSEGPATFTTALLQGYTAPEEALALLRGPNGPGKERAHQVLGILEPRV